MDCAREKAANIQPTVRPTEYRCYIKEVFPICNSGCGNPIVDLILRPPDKLPVPVALDARSPTLFAPIIHQSPENVKPYSQILGIILEEKWSARSI